MSEKTNISWTDATWNPWQGCTKVSPGCAHCYAEARDKRFNGGKHWGKRAPRVRSKDFEAPLRWNAKPWVCDECGLATAKGIEDEPHKCKFGPAVHQSFHRRRIFSLSLGDWLDDEVPIEWLADMLDVIRRCPNLDFLLLTKRPENFESRIEGAIDHMVDRCGTSGIDTATWLTEWLGLSSNLKLNGYRENETPKPPANVWIGTTCEDQERADQRIPELLKIPAVCRFLSMEPLLGPLKFDPHWLGAGGRTGDNYQQPQIHWGIIGGESHSDRKKARGFDITNAREIIQQFKAAGVPVFFKQVGSNPTITRPDGDDAATLMNFPVTGIKDKKGGDMSEWPEDLRVREFPEVAR
jgi:protein gp37